MNLSMKANDERKENIHISHDANLGFMIHITQGELHIRAKEPHEPDASRTTIVADSAVEITR